MPRQPRLSHWFRPFYENARSNVIEIPDIGEAVSRLPHIRTPVDDYRELGLQLPDNTNYSGYYLHITIPQSELNDGRPMEPELAWSMASRYSGIFSQSPSAPILSYLMTKESWLRGENNTHLVITRFDSPDNTALAGAFAHSFLHYTNTPFTNLRFRRSAPLLYEYDENGNRRIRTFTPNQFNQMMNLMLTGQSALFLNNGNLEEFLNGYTSDLINNITPDNIANLISRDFVETNHLMINHNGGTYSYPDAPPNIIESRPIQSHDGGHPLGDYVNESEINRIMLVPDRIYQAVNELGLLERFSGFYMITSDLNEFVETHLRLSGSDRVSIPAPTPQQETQPQQPQRQETQQPQRQRRTSNYQTQATNIPNNRIASNFEVPSFIGQILNQAQNMVDEENINWRDITIYRSQEVYDRLIKKYPGGGVQVTRTRTNALLFTTPNRTTLNAIDKVMEIAKNRPQFGALVLPSTLIQREGLNGLFENERERKLVSVNGAIVKNGGQYEYWYADEGEFNRKLRQLGMAPGMVTGNLDAQYPVFDFRNFDNWQVVNMNNERVGNFNNGYFIPVEQGKALYLPSFAVPDVMVGVEFETPIYDSLNRVMRKVKDRFGVDLDRFYRFFQTELLKREPDASIDGYEFITTTLPLFQAVRMSYYLAEAFKELNSSIPTTRRGEPYGLHINMSIGNIQGRRDSLKFIVQYLRLMEDVIKRLTTSDLRYAYEMRGNGWHLDRSGLRHLLNQGYSQGRILQQFWSQDISEFKKYGGYSEYELLRRGELLTDRVSDGIAEKITKYHTISLSKLLNNGVIEFRHAMYAPDGAYVTNLIGFLSKIAGDMYIGANYYPTELTTRHIGKLIPKKDYTPDEIKKIGKAIFNIKNDDDLKFFVQMYQKCKSLRTTS